MCLCHKGVERPEEDGSLQLWILIGSVGRMGWRVRSRLVVGFTMAEFRVGVEFRSTPTLNLMDLDY